MPANSRGLILAVPLAIIVSCHHPPPLPAVSRAGPALGVMFSAAAWGPDSNRLRTALRAASDSVVAVDSLLAADRRGSEVNRINRGGGSARVRVSPALAAVLTTGLTVARASHGAYRLVPFDTARGTLTLPRGTTLQLDLIARGYALDRAALAVAGVADSAILELGGQYLLIGGQGVRGVGVPDPDDDFRPLAMVGVAPGRSLATTVQPKTPDAGDSLRDPRTGRAATRARSVTVVAATGVAAAAWSRAFFVLGCDTALAQAAAARVAVVCADAQGAVRWTDDLSGRVRQPASGSADSGRPGRVR